MYHVVSAFFACVYYRFPGRKLMVIGVTGTDGKTTTTHLIHHVLQKADKRASMISSVYALIASVEHDTGFHVTSPDPWFIQKSLRKAVDAKETHFVLEVTSHALDQSRVWGIPFSVGVLTNITHEHLDYHRSHDDYLKTKMKLLLGAKTAIVNQEDASYQKVRELLKHTASPKNIITYGLHQGTFNVHSMPFTTQLTGEYNKLNCLAAASCCFRLGVTKKQIRTALSSFTGIIGRFEIIPNNKKFTVIVDFAHTPNALKQVLSTIKAVCKQRIIHVFGSAGLRDSSKRPLMGMMSALYADTTILTEEDYRTENLTAINDQIEKGYAQQVQTLTDTARSHKLLLRIDSREQAIRKALSLAKNGDYVVITGKGHEKSLCRGKTEYPWSDQKAVQDALNSI